ncbi:glycosyltransferase family 4 protein [Haloechinothrix halophila]|uniref:glycosyltransferase family 4 protein n=1 Tax=Haloechinothrix halophila TaxID=1069073 RepID=UPI00041FCEC5|nr:glycosyltransferase family 4 protein [Haloechinothrix halophila]
MTTGVVLVVPGGIDDETAPSGGNVYDRRIRDGLAATGLDVRQIAVAGAWPRPAEAARAELALSLDSVPDGAVVLVDGLLACGVPEVVVPRAARLRLAVLVHMPLADDVGLSGDVAAELDRCERKTLAAAAAVVATSTATARRLAARHGLGAVEVVPPGADRAPLAAGSATGGGLLWGSAPTPPDGEGPVPLVLCVGSLSPLKGQDVLIDALARLADLTWHCRCVGPSRDPRFVADLHGRIERLGLTGRTEVVGAHTWEQVGEMYAACDLVVLPSRAESYGMVVTEALARGIPVVGSGVGGVPEALGDTSAGRPGLLVAPDDSAELAVALRGWLTDAALRHQLRAAARLRRDSLERWPVAARRMADVLRAPAGSTRE